MINSTSFWGSFIYLRRTNFRMCLFSQAKIKYFAITYFREWQVFENFASIYFCERHVFENFKFINFLRISSVKKNKTV